VILYKYKLNFKKIDNDNGGLNMLNMKEVLKETLIKKYHSVKNTLEFMPVVKQRIEEVVNTNTFTIELYEEKDLIKLIKLLSELHCAIKKDSLKK
jgi:hypothetical protein